MVSFMDLFAGCFGDERRAKKGGSSGRATCGTAKPDRAPSGARPGRHGGIREVSCQPVCDAGRDFRGGRIGVGRAGGWAPCSGDPGHHASELSAPRRQRAWPRRQRQGAGSVSVQYGRADRVPIRFPHADLGRPMAQGFPRSHGIPAETGHREHGLPERLVGNSDGYDSPATPGWVRPSATPFGKSPRHRFVA